MLEFSKFLNEMETFLSQDVEVDSDTLEELEEEWWEDNDDALNEYEDNTAFSAFQRFSQSEAVSHYFDEAASGQEAKAWAAFLKAVDQRSDDDWQDFLEDEEAALKTAMSFLGILKKTESEMEDYFGGLEDDVENVSLTGLSEAYEEDVNELSESINAALEAIKKIQM